MRGRVQLEVLLTGLLQPASLLSARTRRLRVSRCEDAVTDEQLIKALRDKQAWFEGKHRIESPDAPPYVPCTALLGVAADRLERLVSEGASQK